MGAKDNKIMPYLRSVIHGIGRSSFGTFGREPAINRREGGYNCVYSIGRVETGLEK